MARRRRLRGYYRQFEGLTEAEVNARLREQAAERRSRELARVPPLDLSQTTWPEYPHPAVVNAITFAARRGLHRYQDRSGGELASELAHRHGVAPGRVVVGDGAAQLLAAAATALLEPGDELLTPWPSYPLYPLLARRARATAVPVPGFDAEALLAAVTPRTRLLVLANPNDPTGELLDAPTLRGLLEALPDRVVVLLDEALRDFTVAEPLDAAVALLDAAPRLLVFRTFSKAWGLAGLRCGYALGGPGAEPLLQLLAPELGVGELALAGALEAVRHLGDLVARRRDAIAAERERLGAALRTLGLRAPASHANIVWVADGAPLIRALDRAGVTVAAGGPLGDPTRARITVPHRPEQTDRLVRALQAATG